MVLQRAHVPFRVGPGEQRAQRIRYDVLDQLRLACRRYAVVVVAFGFDAVGLRLVLRGPGRRLPPVWSVVRSALDVRDPEDDHGSPVLEPQTVSPALLLDVVVWAHLGPQEADPGLPGPLSSPWSSHRDLLGYRRAPFYDRAALADQLDLTEVHRRCGGGPPPSAAELQQDCCSVRGRRGGEGPREPLLLLSHVAGAVLGREPADPKCFGLFAQLARGRGWTVREVADALLVSTRRVRQLCDEQVRELSLAYTALFHPESVGRLP